MLSMLRIILNIIPLITTHVLKGFRRSVTALIHRYTYKPTTCPRNIVIIGGSFTGYHTAYILSHSLPNGYRVILLERNSHFNFTWVLPRFSVVGGEEEKAFIPYGGYLKNTPAGCCEIIHDTVEEVTRRDVVLSGKRRVEYAYLVIATGVSASLPSRVLSTEKTDGVQELRAQQSRIADASNIVVVGGGPAGVEIAADIKDKYPEKGVTLIHSRDRLLNNFGPKLGLVANTTLQDMGVNVLLDHRVTADELRDGCVQLDSREEILCDELIRCTGQLANSSILRNLSPGSIAERGGYIGVLPTLQIADSAFPNIYAAGDVADMRGGNSLAAQEQAETAAENILRAIKGKALKVHKQSWLDGCIQLTLGLHRKVIYINDGKNDILSWSRNSEVAFNCRQAWRQLGAKPFDDVCLV